MISCKHNQSSARCVIKIRKLKKTLLFVNTNILSKKFKGDNILKTKIFKRFIDVEKGFTYYNYIRHSCISVYDTLNEGDFDYILANLDKINTQAIECCFDINNKNMMKKAKENKFVQNYHWFRYFVDEADKSIKVDENIKKLKLRRKVKALLTDQVHELAKREPNMFDKNGEDKGWYKAGKECIIYVQDKKIISVLTYQFEPQNDNIHIYLTYTLPAFRSKGYNTKLFDYIKCLAAKRNVKSISVCTDVTKNNRVPNMFIKNGFVYYKTGFRKII